MPHVEARAEAEKALAAEKHLSWVRLGIVLLNVALWYGFMGRSGLAPALGDAISAIALLYAVGVLAFEPYRRVPALLTSHFTTASDAVLITLWLAATGGFDSPFYVLWYVSITAIAFRYGFRDTILAALVYGAAYVTLVAALGQLDGRAHLVALRVGYIVFIAVVGGYLGRELLEQTMKKLEARERAHDALRSSNATFRSFVRASPLPTVALDADGTVRSWNPAAEGVFGWSAAEAVGRPFRAVPPGEEEAFGALLRRAAAGEALHDRDVVLARKDGERRDVSASTAPLGGGGVIAVFVDVTDRRRAARELEASRREMAQREKLSALGTLVAGVGHEINNPLVYVRSTLDLNLDALRDAVQAPGVPEDVRATLREVEEGERIVREGVERIAHITTSLKQVARAPRGGREPHDLHPILDSVLTVAEARLRGGVVVRRELAATRPAVVSSAEVTQVFLNLVLNAADAMRPQGGGELVVRTFDRDDRVVVEIADTGPGVPEAERHLIFTPFHTTKQDGTGLGLSVSYGIVMGHGGRLSFESAPGRGAVFRVELPASAD